jgi:hypothetical protein
MVSVLCYMFYGSELLLFASMLVSVLCNMF